MFFKQLRHQARMWREHVAYIETKQHTDKLNNQVIRGFLHQPEDDRVPVFLVKHGNVICIEGQNPINRLEWHDPRYLTWPLLLDFFKHCKEADGWE